MSLAEEHLAAGDELAGRFEILEQIGEGGISLVYKAKDKRLGSVVALKILKDQSEDNLSTIKSEFRHIRDITHPFLVETYELFADQQPYFFTMEFLDGESLEQHIWRGDTPENLSRQPGRLRLPLASP